MPCLVENHNQVLDFWVKRSFRNSTVIHFDAHLDFDWRDRYPFNTPPDDPVGLTNYLGKCLDEYYSCYLSGLRDNDWSGNFLYLACKKGIVERIIWVIPDNVITPETVEYIEDIELEGRIKLFRAGQSYMEFEIEGVEITVIPFNFLEWERLVKKHPILLDIDTDFMMFDSILHSYAAYRIGRRHPYINVERLLKKVLPIQRDSKFVSIALSVDGGFVPLSYKDRGATLYKELGLTGSIDEILEGVKYYNEAMRCYKMCDFDDARQWYRKALKTHSSIRCNYNNSGMLYLRESKFKEAEYEFRKTLFLDPEDYYSWCGLGFVGLVRKDIELAELCFNKGFGFAPHLLESKIGKALILLSQGQYEKAKVIVGGLK